jgi:hypothetical protein
MSHTVKIAIEFQNRTALSAAVEAIGGTVRGEGTHYLFAGQEQGFCFELPGWRYPLVLRSDNTLAFDDYHGSWGNVKDIDKLKGAYAIEAAHQAASEQGWISERQADGTLLIYHPSGGTFTVTNEGVMDATGFVGTSCDVAAVIEAALGPVSERQNKADYYVESVHIRE